MVPAWALPVPVSDRPVWRQIFSGEPARSGHTKESRTEEATEEASGLKLRHLPVKTGSTTASHQLPSALLIIT